MAQKSAIKILPYLEDKVYQSLPPNVKPCGFKKGGETFTRNERTWCSNGEDLQYQTKISMGHTHSNTKASCLICMENKPRATQRWCRVCNTNGICAGCFRTLSSQGNDGFDVQYKFTIARENLHNVKCPNCRSCGYYGPKGIRQTKVLPTNDYGAGGDSKRGSFRMPKVAEDLDIKKQTRVINTKLNEIMDIYTPLVNKKESVLRQNEEVEALPEIIDMKNGIKIAELELEELKRKFAEKADEVDKLKQERLDRETELKDVMPQEQVIRLNAIFTYMLMTKLKWFLAMDFAKNNVNEVEMIKALEEFTRPFIKSNSEMSAEPYKWKKLYYFVGEKYYGGKKYYKTGYPTANMLSDVLQFDKATFFDWFNLNIMGKDNYYRHLEGANPYMSYRLTNLRQEDFKGKHGVEVHNINDYSTIPFKHMDCIGEELMTKINECVKEGAKLVELWCEISMGIKHPKVVEEDIAYSEGGASKAQITSQLTEDELRALLAKFSSK